MVTRLYTIYDVLAEESGPVFQAVNDEVAYRQFQTQLQTIPNIREDDFKLICVGEYDNVLCETQQVVPVTIDQDLIDQIKLEKDKKKDIRKKNRYTDVYRQQHGPVPRSEEIRESKDE